MVCFVVKIQGKTKIVQLPVFIKLNIPGKHALNQYVNTPEILIK